MVEGADVEAELPGEIEHLRHLVGAVAVVLHQDLAARARRPASPAGGRGRAGRPLPSLRSAMRPTRARYSAALIQGRAVARHVAHPGGGALLLP